MQKDSVKESPKKKDAVAVKGPNVPREAKRTVKKVWFFIIPQEN